MTVTPQRPDPVAAADGAAIALARRLLVEATHAALAWTDPETGTPGISRIGLTLDPKGLPLALVSALAPHTPALRAHPEAALLVGEPGERGDPLTYPRLMIRVRAVFMDRKMVLMTSAVLLASPSLIWLTVWVNRLLVAKMSVSSAKQQKISRAMKWFISWRCAPRPQSGLSLLPPGLPS